VWISRRVVAGEKFGKGRRGVAGEEGDVFGNPGELTARAA